MKSVFNSFYNSIHQFNYLAGKPYPKDPDGLEFLRSLDHQIERIQEELNELREAIKYNDKVEVLDGVVDILFTVLPLPEMLYEAGYKVEPACMEVAKNNLTKFTTSYDVAVKTAEKYGEEYCYIDSTQYNGITYYVVKRKEDQKVLKVVGYESVNLEKFVPEEK